MQMLSDSVTRRSQKVATQGRVRLYWSRRLFNAAALAGSELLALALVVLLTAFAANPTAGAPSLPGWFGLVVVTWVVGALFMRLLPGWGLSAPTELKRMTQLLLFVFGGTAIALGVTRTMHEPDRFVLLIGLVLAWPLVLATRFSVRRLLQRAGAWGVPAVVYGGATTGRLLVSVLREQPQYGYVPVGVFDDDPLLHGTRVDGVPVLGSTVEATHRAPIAILAMPGISRERMVELLEGPLSAYPNVVIIPDLFEIESLWVKTCDFNGILGLEVSRSLLDPIAQAGKRAFDLMAVILTAPVWVPVCLLIGVLIWLEDRANPVFLQRRVGVDRQPFMTWKFRTMLPDAEEVLRQRLATDPELRAEWEANYKLRRDPRITRVGGILRKTSLDELPQLVNVLLGQMSLVGPRPLPAYHHEQLPRHVQDLRVRVRPGMTGLWQVSGRSEAGNIGMERWDPYYVRNWSFWLDVVVLLRTVKVVIKGSGAY